MKMVILIYIIHIFGLIDCKTKENFISSHNKKYIWKDTIKKIHIIDSIKKTTFKDILLLNQSHFLLFDIFCVVGISQID
jgi:hypothetical protein